MALQINEKLAFFHTEKHRFKAAYGGRNGGKSWDAAASALLLGTQSKKIIVCLREYQKNLRDSVHRLLSDLIQKEPLLQDFYIIERDRIYGRNGTEFVFSGIKNAVNFKSFEGADIAWVEEAQALSARSLQILTPTIRKIGSEIWFTFNPNARTDPIYQFTVDRKSDKLKSVLINYNDNPNCPMEMIEEAEEMRRDNYALYEHIWLGKPLDITDDVIFKDKFVVKELEIEWYDNKPYYNSNYLSAYYGMDFGFSVDPAAIPEVLMIDSKTLYINREIYQVKLLITKYIEKIKEVMPEAIAMHSKFSADCSRPDSIAELGQMGLNIELAPKPKGSVESGIEWMQGMNIIINPKCVNTIYEFHNYKYKKDALTGKILRDPIDANNHIIDAIRYAMWSKIQAKSRVITFTEADIRALESIR